MPGQGSISVGDRFGRLTIIGPSPRRRATGRRWGCRCDCGMIVVVAASKLASGNTRSCGCLRDAVTRQRTLTHGLTDAIPEYHVWTGMRGRCLNPRNRVFLRYGGRGITICPAWDTFEVFLFDMGLRPSPRHSLERIDNDGPYSAENCRWATQSEQMRNTSATRLLACHGQTRCLTEWAEVTGLKMSTIHVRLRRGWSVEQALHEPLRGETSRWEHI